MSKPKNSPEMSRGNANMDRLLMESNLHSETPALE